jgi:uncharacterized membrane protein YagU involved in acid resistance
MNWREITRRGMLPGALAGLAGGMVSGIALSQIGALPSTASLVRLGSPVVGFTVHLVVAVLLGAAFGVLVWQQRTGAGETLFWGLTYGTIWWFLGPLTLQSVLQIGVVAWDVHSAQEAFPSLVAHLIYGAVTGLALAAIRRSPGSQGEAPPADSPALLFIGVLLRGALAGVLGGWLLGRLAGGQPQTIASLWIGLLAGVSFAVLYPDPPDGTGPALIRGMVYGFFWWVVWPMTLLPLTSGARLTWSLELAQSSFALLPPYLLVGAATALVYQWLDGLAQALFSDVKGRGDEEGMGTEGLRALGRGALAGLVGGVVFTLVMMQIGFLPVAAGLIGSRSLLTGLVVQLVIADVIGMSYGLLFRRQSYDVGSALGWGVSYGFFWWVLGALTLMPALLGAAPQWTVQAASALFGSLIGHLAFGAGLGVVFHWLEARHNPWWLPRTRMEEARVARRKEQLLTAAPALWALVVVIALTLPVLLST